MCHIKEKTCIENVTLSQDLYAIDCDVKSQQIFV